MNLAQFLDIRTIYSSDVFGSEGLFIIALLIYVLLIASTLKIANNNIFLVMVLALLIISVTISPALLAFTLVIVAFALTPRIYHIFSRQ